MIRFSLDGNRRSWRWVFVLWLLVLVSGVMVVNVSHLCRQLFTELAVLEREENRLQVGWGQYLLEQSTLASLKRVEQVAVEELGMSVPPLDQVIMVEP